MAGNKVVAILLLLAVVVSFAMVSPQQVQATKLGCRDLCRDFEKTRLLNDCGEAIMPGGGLLIPGRNSNCCLAVRAVPGMDMQCIVRILTPGEKKEYSQGKILALRNYCR